MCRALRSSWVTFTIVVLVFLLAITTLGEQTSGQEYQDVKYTGERQQSILHTSDIPAPPTPEPIDVVELLLPPVSASRAIGACTAAINPHRTGCIAKDIGVDGHFQAGDFTPDGNSVVVTVEFVGAPAAPDPASIYNGTQLILIKADGLNFSNGVKWKCLSCGVAPEHAIGLNPQNTLISSEAAIKQYGVTTFSIVMAYL
jgi:hypothetical protein